MTDTETIQVLYTKIDQYKNKVLTLIAEVERLRAREKSARVCDWCGMCPGIDPACRDCAGKGIVYDG